MYFDFCVYLGLKTVNMVNEVVLALTQRKRMLLKIVVLGGVWAKDFDFRSWRSISCCFFSTPGNSAKNSPENAHLMQTSANHHRWTVQVSSIRMIYSLWRVFSPVGSALASVFSG